MASYERTSACWHQWLQLADFERELQQPIVAVPVAVAEEAEEEDAVAEEEEEEEDEAVAMVGGQLLAAGRWRPILPKKRKSTRDRDELRSSTSHPLVKKTRLEVPDNIRQAMKLISEFYQSIE